VATGVARRGRRHRGPRRTSDTDRPEQAAQKGGGENCREKR
jgi:hypothetical protein